jgi:hypothetical protein
MPAYESWLHLISHWLFMRGHEFETFASGRPTTFFDKCGIVYESGKRLHLCAASDHKHTVVADKSMYQCQDILGKQDIHWVR